MRNVRAMALHVIGECRRADGKDQIVAIKERNDLFASGGKESCKQRMIFWKATTSAHGGSPDQGLMPFGQADDFVECIVAIDRGAHNKRGTFALIQCVADSFNQPRLGPN